MTVDDYTVHQLKEFNGKKLKTTAEEGLDPEDEAEEINLSITSATEMTFLNYSRFKTGTRKTAGFRNNNSIDV